jgi:hypothetical protein
MLIAVPMIRMMAVQATVIREIVVRAMTLREMPIPEMTVSVTADQAVPVPGIPADDSRSRT